MLSSNLVSVSFDELTAYLAKVETSPIKAKSRESGSMTITVCPTSASVASLSNIELVCRWTVAHDCAVSIMCVENDIEISIKPLY